MVSSRGFFTLSRSTADPGACRFNQIPCDLAECSTRPGTRWRDTHSALQTGPLPDERMAQGLTMAGIIVVTQFSEIGAVADAAVAKVLHYEWEERTFGLAQPHRVALIERQCLVELAKSTSDRALVEVFGFVLVRRGGFVAGWLQTDVSQCAGRLAQPEQKLGGTGCVTSRAL